LALFINSVEYLKSGIVRILLAVAVPVILFVILGRIQEYYFLIDNFGIPAFLKVDISGTNYLLDYDYFKREYLFFMVSSWIILFVLELRVINDLLRRLRKL